MGLNLEAVGSGMPMKLLWENENPTETFPAQTISLSLSSYDLICIVINNSIKTIFPPLFLSKNERGIAVQPTVQNVYRAFTFNENGVVVEDAMIINSYGNENGTKSGINCIPIKIYGIKL